MAGVVVAGEAPGPRVGAVGTAPLTARISLAFPAVHRRGGVERVVGEVAGYLHGRGHDVHLYARTVDWPGLGATVHLLPAPPGPAFLDPVAFQRETTPLVADADVVGTFGTPSPRHGVFWVPSVHAAWLAHSRATRGRWSAARWKQRLNPMHPVTLTMERRHFSPGGYGRLVAHTSHVADDLSRHYGVPRDDVAILPNGYDPAQFSPGRAALLRAAGRARLGVGEDDRIVLFVANELERKGFGPLLAAFATLDDPRARLVVVGRVGAGGYARAIAEAGLTDRVTFTGPANDVARAFAAADVFALPTAYESWGLVVVEALACGVPVLVSRLAGASEAVQDGVTGVLLDDPSDVEEIRAGLVRLLDGEAAPPDVIGASVARYTWAKVLPRYEELLLGRTAPA